MFALVTGNTIEVYIFYSSFHCFMIFAQTALTRINIGLQPWCI
jgi:hypothetical protein